MTREALKPEAIELLLARAYKLEDAKESLVQDWNSTQYDASEEKRMLFVERNIHGFFDEEIKDVISKRDSIDRMRTTLYARLEDEESGNSRCTSIEPI